MRSVISVSLILSFFLVLTPLGVVHGDEVAGKEIASSQQSTGAPTETNPAQRDVRESVRVTLQDLELVDQEGTVVRFKSDIVADRVAVVIPFYTTCTTSYPILIFMFSRLQEMLGERLGKEVVLISVSVDPKTDIPVRLKAFARRQKAKPGWVFLFCKRI